MKHLLLLVFLLLNSTIFLIAQTIGGKVTDVSNNPIVGVNVSAQNGRGGVTNIRGEYHLKLEKGECNILFQHLSYVKQNINISILENEQRLLNIVLKDQKHNLQDVQIISKRDKVNSIMSVEIIKPEFFIEKPIKDMSDIANQISGVTLTDKQISIRGGSGGNPISVSRVLVMIDDIPLLSGDMGQIPWGLIAIENIDKIEIIKGASSAFYGSSALNGVINIMTKFPDKSLIIKHPSKGYTQINTLYGYYGNPKREELAWWRNDKQEFSGIDFMHSDIFGNTSISFGGNYFKDDGYRLGERIKRERIVGGIKQNSKKFRGLNYGIKGVYMSQESGMFLLWESFQNAYIPLDTNLYTTKSSLFHFDPHIILSTINGTHKIKGRILKMSLDNSTNGVETGKDMFSKTYYIDYKYKGGLNVLNSNIVIGGTSETVLADAEIFNGSNYGSTNSLYTFLEKKIKKLTLSFGCRYEFINIKTDKKIHIESGDTTNNFSVNFPLFYTGMKYKMNQKNSLRAYWGQGIRFPSIAEMFVFTNAHRGTYIYPNTSLKPEYGWSFELGYNFKKQEEDRLLSVDIAYFIMRYHDMMEFGFAQWGTIYDMEHAYGLGFKTINIGRTQINGAEFELKAEIPISSHLNAKIMGGYTYMQPISLTPNDVYAKTNIYGNVNQITFNNSSSDTTILKYRYKHLLKVDAEIDYKRYSLGMSCNYNDYMRNVDKLFTTDLVNEGIPEANIPPIVPGINDSREQNKKGDILINLRMGVDLSDYTDNYSVKLNFIINNVLNSEILTRPTDLRPPRTYSFKLNISI